MREFAVENEGEDEGTAVTAVAPTTPTRVIVGFTATTTTPAAVATTTATSCDYYYDDDGSNNNDGSAAACRAGNRAAAKSPTGKERKGSTAPLVIVIEAVAEAELSVHAPRGSSAASSTG